MSRILLRCKWPFGPFAFSELIDRKQRGSAARDSECGQCHASSVRGSRAGACFAGGNVLVCAAVKRERKLRSMFNYFLVSLALSDMLSAILVMPLSIMRQLVGQHTAILCIDVKNINYSFAVC